jgi:(1->4)-alpha-D-glucan 1-alpha-D-glucosylmutase
MQVIDGRAPRATYRVQFRKEFGFADAAAIVPYLARLGVSHVYASPLLTARPGSTHGYDIVDHDSINPEFGGEAGFDRFVEALHGHDMGLILDIVPNHMWVGQENPSWMDVLEWGRASTYAGRFDILWDAPGGTSNGKLVLPVLGDRYGRVLERGEIALAFDAAAGVFLIRYFEKPFPLNLRSQIGVLRAISDRAEDAGLDALLRGLDDCLRGQMAGTPEGREVLRKLRAQASQILSSDGRLHKLLDEELASINGTPGEPASFDKLHQILEEQHYRLAFWRVAAQEINYRRFFDINELAGLRMERAELFESSHRLIGRLIAQGKVQGLRVDHIDGLRDPEEYLERLQRLADREWRPGAGALSLYVAVEKILASHERLRPEWPVAGDTGYAFMAAVNGLFVDAASERFLTRFYRLFTGDAGDYEEAVGASKRLIMNEVLSSDLNVLASMFYGVAQQSRDTRDFTLSGLREALEDVVAHFPVYRTYVTPRGLDAQDKRDIDWAVGRARKAARTPDVSIYDFIASILTLDILKPSPRRYRDESVIDAALRFQQYTGPVMAKAAEDTAFYRYTRLLSLNEVGSNPGHFSVSASALHEANRIRQRDFPSAMLGGATHDHKRGEDMRARLNVLSEIPRDWAQHVRRWSKWNTRKKTGIDGRTIPEANMEYLFYQTIVGAWPIDIRSPDYAGLEMFRDRVGAYMRKAAREAKLHTSWMAPDEDYEAALAQFVARALSPEYSRPFLDSVFAFVERIAPAGAVNSLAQTLLKLTCPGAPDIYQGTESWDFSLVDPDNRRPVDYAALAAPAEAEFSLGECLATWRDGRVKQALIQRVLTRARSQAELFARGAYREIPSVGEAGHKVFAFARTFQDGAAIVAAPRLVAREIMRNGDLRGAVWGDTSLVLEGKLEAREFTDVLSGRTIAASSDGRLAAADVFADLPVALLMQR